MLSLIVPARNSGPLTRDCVKSALYSVNKLGLKCQVILIDDLSNPADGILDVFREMRELGRQWHDFTIVRTAKHEHYTGAFSIGLSLATREHAFFLSNDMLITPSFFTAALGVAGLSSEIGAVRGVSPHVDALPQHVIPSPATVTDYPGMEEFSKHIFDKNGLACVEDTHFCGDAVLLLRPLIDAIGVLDTRFFGYFGDTDYGMRAQLAKFKLVCAKGAWLFHSGAGHIRGDAAKSGDINRHLDQRKTEMRSAYQALRDKWGREIPNEYAGEETLKGLSAIAGRSAARAPLKFELPSKAVAELQRY